MVKVYICTEGDYSDHHIAGVFATREAAEAFIEAEPEAFIEEWEAYDQVPHRLRFYEIRRNFLRRGYTQIGSEDVIQRIQFIRWPWEGPLYANQKRLAWNYDLWDSGEHAWGTDEAAVEKVWKEQHAAEEALEAGV